ncbi:MAG: PspA/IM30 family protein [Planctomycetes bacterium]|nr:PspA/IM30 family protein [Planctomycetota bacterium]
MFRSIFGWMIEVGEDPELILKQNVRDMQDQIPQMNEQVAMMKAQVTLAGRGLDKLKAREADLVSKAKAALQGDRRDLALNFATALQEVRREITQQEGTLKIAEQHYAKAETMRKAHLKMIEEKIAQTRAALSQKRQAEWQSKVADSMDKFQVGGVDATHDQMIEQIERDTAHAEAKMDIALESTNVDEFNMEQEAKQLQANATLRALELELGIGDGDVGDGDVNAPPEAPATSSEKTIGERETA